MDIEAPKRPATAVLDLKDCPVCGALHGGVKIWGKQTDPGPSIEASFACGSIFASYGGAPVEPKNLCPGPSRVAADYINRECEP